MATKLILNENVPNLGEIGDIVEVADGFARNYLVPRGLATTAHPGTLRQMEAKKQRIEAERQEEIAAAQALAGDLATNSVTIPMQAGDDDKLYGSVTAQHIADALNEMGFEIDRKQVLLAEPIRQLGVYDVDVQLHAEAVASIKVWVVKA